MTNPTPPGQVPDALPAIQRFEVVDCIDSKHVPAVIPKPHGPWVRYEDHAAALCRLHAENEALRAQQDDACDHGPQAETVEEAARDVGKWLNERPNRPLDLRHVAMLTHHAKRTQQAGEVEGWLTWFRTPSGGREPNYSHGAKKPTHGAELDAILTKYPVYAEPRPSPAAQAASSAVLKAIREANMQLVRTGDNAFMLVPYKVATAHAAGSVPAGAERAAFEANWCERNHPVPLNSRLRDDGRYGDHLIQSEWEAWQASAARAPAESVPAVSDLPPLPDPDLRDVGTKPQDVKDFLNGYATEYARLALAARAPAESAPVVLGDDELVRLGKSPESGLHPWGVGTTRADYLRALRAVLAAARAPAESVLEDAARYRWLFGARTEAQAASVPETVFKPLPQDEVLSRLQGFYMSKPEVDALVDAAHKQGANHDNH